MSTPECKGPAVLRQVIDRRKCEGKEDCLRVCPYGVFEMGVLSEEQKAEVGRLGLACEAEFDRLQKEYGEGTPTLTKVIDELELKRDFRDRLLEGMSPEQRAAVVEPRVAVLPVGAFEQHGPHLPLATDTLVAVAISNAIAEVVPVRQLPPVAIGCSHEHAPFPGTLSISATTLAAIVTDVAASLRGQGIEHLVVVNGHGGNYVLSNVVQQAVPAVAVALLPATQANRAGRGDSRSHQMRRAGGLHVSLRGHQVADHESDTVRTRLRQLHHAGRSRRAVKRPPPAICGTAAETHFFSA